MNPRAEAEARIGAGHEVRVLEPSPPAVATEPFADDPTARGRVAAGATLVSPVTTGDVTWDDLARHDPDLARWCATRWLGAWPRLPAPVDAAAVSTARRAWHAVAEHVLAPARHATTGRIGLRYTRRGFGTPFFGADRQVRVEADELVVEQRGREQRSPLTTLGSAAAQAGVVLGTRTGVYEPSTPDAADLQLEVDDAAAHLLGEWLGLATSALEQLRAESTGSEPSLLQLWPEHFDLACDLGDERDGSRANFGASPGDEAHGEPYLYIGPWDPARAAADPFFADTAFAGASLPYRVLAAALDPRAEALRFLRAGRDRLGGGALRP